MLVATRDSGLHCRQSQEYRVPEPARQGGKQSLVPGLIRQAVLQIEWVDSSSDGFGMKVQPAEVEIDRIGEPLPEPKTPATNPGHPDLAVDTSTEPLATLRTTALRMSHGWFLIVLATCLTVPTRQGTWNSHGCNPAFAIGRSIPATSFSDSLPSLMILSGSFCRHSPRV